MIRCMSDSISGLKFQNQIESLNMEFVLWFDSFGEQEFDCSLHTS